MLKDKKGFTLIEFVISMAIFAVVAGAVTIFMITGTNSFNRTKHELDLQLQTQTVVSQIADMIRSADYVKYEKINTGGKDINSLSIYQLEEKAVTPSASPGAAITPSPSPIAGVDPTKVIEKNVTNKKVVYWITSGTSSKSMYLEEFSSDATPTYGAADDNLFAEYVTDFKANVTKKAVKLSISMKNDKSKYTIDETVSWRNRTVTP